MGKTSDYLATQQISNRVNKMEFLTSDTKKTHQKQLVLSLSLNQFQLAKIVDHCWLKFIECYEKRHCEKGFGSTDIAMTKFCLEMQEQYLPSHIFLKFVNNDSSSGKEVILFVAKDS